MPDDIADPLDPLEHSASGERTAMDGLTAIPSEDLMATPVVQPIQPAPLMPPPAAVSHMKHLLIRFGSIVYVLYVLWAAALMSILPSTAIWAKSLVSAGLFSALGALVVLVGFGMFAFQRIAKSEASISTKQRSLFKTVLIVLPGLAVSLMLPFTISRQPALSIDITSPTQAEDFVAPLAVTYSVQSAMEVLARDGLQPTHFAWDFEGDGKVNDEGVIPTSTAYYQRSGGYTVSVVVSLSNGTQRTLARTITIPTSVFTLEPAQPIVERPVKFSIADLIEDPKTFKEVAWDFDGDGVTDETSPNLETVHTYYSTGPVNVTATYLLTNQTQKVLKRTIDIQNPPKLPFPVTLNTEPQNLIGPAPFGAIFTIQTDEPLREIEWSYGDGKTDRGADLKRVLHSYDSTGIYPLTVKIRSASGAYAELSAIVRATEELQLPDLSFQGEPDVNKNSWTVSGQVPLTVELTPSTALPLVQFSWEAPQASTFSATGTTLNATYLEQGSYKLVLLAQDANGRAMRQTINVDVQPPAAEASILTKPEGGTAPLHVVFDASNSFVPPDEKIAGFEWKFGDEQQGDKPELGAARTEHTYTDPGEYAVTLRIVLTSGKSYDTSRTIVVRKPTLSACITASRTRTQIGKGIEFDSSCSTGQPVNYLWDIHLADQPTISQAQSPDPNYIFVPDTAGDYVVSLILQDEFDNKNQTSISFTVTP